MAMLEKPKYKKKHKIKVPDIDTAYLANVDIEFPTTSTPNDVSSSIKEDSYHGDIKEDCTTEEISSKTKEIISENSVIIEQNYELDKSDIKPDVVNKSSHDHESVDDQLLIKENSGDLNDNVMEQIEANSIIEPTAPPPMEITENKVKHLLIQYPNLQEMHTIENKTMINLKVIANEQQVQSQLQQQIKPFTEQELNKWYSNPKIATAQLFEMEFLNIELSSNYKTHVFYQYLMKYYKSRYKLKVNGFDLDGLKKTFTQTKENVWCFVEKEQKISGTCKDNVIVRKFVKHECAELDNDQLNVLMKNLNDTTDLLSSDYTLNLYNTEVYKILIEQYIWEVLNCNQIISAVDHKSVQFSNSAMSKSLLDAIQDNRIIISILFGFIRRPMPDKIFQKNIRIWLEKSIAVHLRVSTWRDHLFLLYHILRCPSGIGEWAIPLIQMPKPQNILGSSFENEELSYCMTYLSVLLLPIKERSIFLSNLYNHNIDDTTECFGSTATTGRPSNDTGAKKCLNDDPWIVIDSDGEEDRSPSGEINGLKESDIIALFNQVPFQQIFRNVNHINNILPFSVLTFTDTINGKLIIQDEFITGHHLLKFIAFTTNLVQLLGQGLKTYDTERYRQFAKMLSRLVRHAVQYVSDMYDIYKLSNGSSSSVSEINSRIFIEYNVFVIRACYYIYKSRNVGTWQYLANLPYSHLSMNTIWKLYYALNVGFPEHIILSNEDFIEKINETEFRNEFFNSLIDIPDEYLHYLFQTFSSMVLSRNINTDILFIEKVTVDLLEIGYLHKTTKENYYKIVRDLLLNIVSQFPQLMSTLLNIIKEHPKSIEHSIVYLFKFLPIDKWWPSIIDFEVLSKWLLNFHFESAESVLARTIIYRLNWNLNSDNELHLSHDIHVRMACLIAEVASKHAPEVIGVSSISEGVRQVSNLVSGQTPHQQFIIWCWNMVSLLHLHSLDQNNNIKQITMKSPGKLLCVIPELEQVNAIAQGVSDQRPIAIYLSILITTYGHSVPVICHKGFHHMELLLNDYRYVQVLRCLQLIVPLFFECPESLYKYEKFQLIIKQLLTLDRTYLRMAKDFITSDNRGPVIELFGKMLQSQIISYNSDYGHESPTIIIDLWLQSLTNLNNWNKNGNILYLIDLILCIAFLFNDSWNAAKMYFKQLFKMHDDSAKSSKSTFLPFFGGNNSVQSNPLIPSPSATTLWLSLLCLEIEHEIVEWENNFWSELLRQLRMVDGKFSLDSVIKKTSNIIGLQTNTHSIQSLVLYKWANLILSCPYNHHLLPVACQQFFRLYLARIPLNADEMNVCYVYGVANKFFDSNITVMKKLKTYFIAGSNHYKEQALKETDENFVHILNERFKLFNSFVLWLEETRLNIIYDIEVNQNNFPPQYDLNRVRLIFQQNDRYWTEFIYTAGIRELQKNDSNEWLKHIFRYDFNSNRKLSLSSPRIDNDQEQNPKENIIRHIQSYDTPIAPPIFIREPSILKRLFIDKKNVLQSLLLANFKCLDQTAKSFDMKMVEVSSLNNNYKSLITKLFRITNEQKTVYVQCNSIVSRSCAGGATIRYNVMTHAKNNEVDLQLNNNRERYNVTINAITATPPKEEIIPLAQFQFYLKEILDLHKELKQKLNDPNEYTKFELVNKHGITLFYNTIDGFNKTISTFPLSEHIYEQILLNLGTLIKEDQQRQGMKLLKRCVEIPNLLHVLLELFDPSNAEPICFLEMYKFIIDCHRRKYDASLLMKLLYKFNISMWLIQIKPKFSDRNELIKLIVYGIESWNQTDAKIIVDVLRKHLLDIFEYDFPEHYGEILQIILKGCSEQKLKPYMLMDLLCSVYKLSGCVELKTVDGIVRDRNAIDKENQKNITNFATNQKIFTYKDLDDTMVLLARHFHNDRLQFGLHGLYPKHKDYCDTIILFLRTFNSSLIVSSIYTYPGMLGDKLVEMIWIKFCYAYGPWIIPYNLQCMENPPAANWIKQLLSNNQLLLPWSELHIESSNKMLSSFIGDIEFLLRTFPACDSILGYIFYWYDVQFENQTIPEYVLKQIHSSLMQLQWEKFKPTQIHILGVYKILQQYMPSRHSFCGHIFLKIQWTNWLTENFNLWKYDEQQTILSALLSIILKMSLVPNVRENPHFITILSSTIHYPWTVIENQKVEQIMEWFVITAEPHIVLGFESEYRDVDEGVFKLLQSAFAFDRSSADLSNSTLSLRSKRFTYIKTIIRLLNLCSTKYVKILENKDGVNSFQLAVKNLLNLIENALKNVKNDVDRDSEIVSLLMEILHLVHNQNKSEILKKLFIESIIIWEAECEAGSLILCNFINAIGACKTYSNQLLKLLEATITNYFKCYESTKDANNSSWKALINRLGTQFLSTIELNQFVNEQHLFALHIFAIYKLRKLTAAEQITFLENLHTLLEQFKTSETNESQFLILWGLIIATSYQILKLNTNAQNHLLKLGRYLQTLANQSDGGWGNGLLGVIGLRKGTITNKRRILTRCLSCIVFSLFPENENTPCQEYLTALHDLKTILVTKRFTDVRIHGQLAVNIIELQPKDLTKTIENICNILKLFFNENFITSLDNVWTF